MPATPAGEMRETITFQRATEERGGMGVKKAASWADNGSAKAKVLYGTGAERRQSGVEAGTQAATFRCRSSAVTRGARYTDRIVFNGINWDITGIAPLGTVPTEIEFTAVANRG